MPEPNGNKRRDFSIFDDMSTEMLEAILRADSQLPDGENSDTDAVLYIMEVIAKREKERPTGKFTDVNAAWTSFSENYLPYANGDKSLYDFDDTEEQSGVKQITSAQPSRPLKSCRLMRIACIAAAITALLLTGTVTASALGFDLWGAVAKWTRDTFGFSNSVSESKGSQGSDGQIKYRSLQEALDSYGITAKLAPTWFPDRYSLQGINVSKTPVKTTFFADYISDDGEITITITSFVDPTNRTYRTYEKDNETVTLYLKDGIQYYIMSNLAQTQIVWQAENFECSISGNYSLDEARKMIDSIYERK